MSFWSGVEKVFKSIGHFVVDFTVDLPKIVHAGTVAAQQIPTIVTDLGTLLNAVSKLATVAVKEARPIIAALVALATSVFEAASSGLVNISEDEQVIANGSNLIAAIKADYPSFVNFTSALDGVVTAYDNVADQIKTAVTAVEQATE